MLEQVRYDDLASVHLADRKGPVMILAALALAAQLTNPGFEQGLRGWQAEGHRGMRAAIGSNRFYTVPQAARGDHYLDMGWRARNAAPREAAMRVFQQIDARRYRGRTIRVSAQTRAPDFAQGFGSLIVRAAGSEARTGISASETWRRHAVELRVPRNARQIEIAFMVEATQAELNADDIRIELVRR
jgi:hypothetical protein